MTVHLWESILLQVGVALLVAVISWAAQQLTLNQRLGRRISRDGAIIATLAWQRARSLGVGS